MVGSARRKRASSHRRCNLLIVVLAVTIVLAPDKLLAVKLVENPFFEEMIAAGTLPPVSERIPAIPSVVKLGEATGEILTAPGKAGGRLRLIMGKEKDIRMLTVYGYSRLVGFNADLEIRPDILASVKSDNNREFRLMLRPGHRWSDGHPFTAEDFEFYWRDVALNDTLSPHGPPSQLLVGGELPEVTFPNETTIVYRFKEPNPYFLPSLAGARPLYIYAPKHYLKQFHAGYANPEQLEKMVKKSGKRNWAGVYYKYSKLYKQTNPALPTLQPWLNTTKPPSERFLFVRNPFYHRIDENGVQLPYIDQVEINIASSSLVAAKAGAGESDLQARNIRLDNVPFLKQGEQRNHYDVRLWSQAMGSQVALYPNFNSTDESWRKLVRDVRFRRALSLLIHREEINQVVYFGLVVAGANTVLPMSNLYKEEYDADWYDFEPDRANALLDEIGLSERDSDGIRLMPDGRPLKIIVQTAGESTEETDILELIHDSWLHGGIKLYSRPSQREVFRDRIFSGQAMMSVWTGVPNGLPTATLPPDDFVPSSQDQLQWPQWGQYVETDGGAGAKPDLPDVQRLVELNAQWREAKTDENRASIWHEILSIHADNVFSLGTVRQVPQPVVVSRHLRNVPDVGVYNWNPGAFFGMYHPDTFWFDEERRQ